MGRILARLALLGLSAAVLAACRGSLPYMGHPKFSFDYPEDWEGPVAIDDGVRFQDPSGRATLEAAYHPTGSRAYKTPTVFKQYMREQGSVEDSHVIDEVPLATGTAHRVFFTTYEYDPRYALGAKKDVFCTELFMVPDRWGMFVLRFQARKEAFRGFARDFQTVLKTLIIAEPSAPAP